jgi:serine-aspartate repeat-containing protein C/D/E
VGKNFVDSNNGSISGTVKDDNCRPIPGVTVTLLDDKGITVDTAMTNADGGYVFNEVEPGEYTVVETQPAGYPNSVSDYDEDPDGDAGDADKTLDIRISVTARKAGEAYKENNVVDSDNGSISGSVCDDNGNSLPCVVFTLLDSNLDAVQTTTTDGIGAHKFSEVEPGIYTVVEVNPPGFPSSLCDYDNTPDGYVGHSNSNVDDTIPVTLNPGKNDDGNNFVDENNAAISGTVKYDEGKALVNVKIELLQGNTVVGSTLTSGIGNYTFSGVEPGDYVVKETNPVDYPKNLNDGDTSDDGDADDLSTAPDNLIKVALKAGELDSDNDFVDSNNGSISGTVKDDKGKPPPGVEIQLQTPDRTVVATTTSGSDGTYTFPSVEPDSYVLVEKNPDGYPGGVSDYDTSPDGDAGEGVVNADSKIPLILQPAEDDSGNDFVDRNNGSISGTVNDDQGNVLSRVDKYIQRIVILV